MELATNLPQAQLLTGSAEATEKKTTEILKLHLCKTKKATCICVQCKKIKSQTHHGIVQICPAGEYKISDVEVIFEKTRFALDDNENFFFVLKKAHTINSATANRLLKTLEEPPAGYHFILETTNLDAIIPTIKSRCHIINLSGQDDGNMHPLLQFFYLPAKLDDPAGFDAELRKHHLSCSQSAEFLGCMLQTFSTQFSNDIRKGKTARKNRLTEILELLKTQIKTPPQQGSSKIFWRNLYLRFPRKKGDL